MKINQLFEVKFQEARAIKSKRLRRVLNLKLNPPSSNDNGDVNEEKKNNSRRVEGNEALNEDAEGKKLHKKGSASSESREGKHNGNKAKQLRRKQQVNSMTEAPRAARERAGKRSRKILPQRGTDENLTTDLEATIPMTPVKLSDKFSAGPAGRCVETASSTPYDGREADDSPSNSNQIVEAATRARRKRPNSDEQVTNPKCRHLARGGFEHARAWRVAGRKPEDSTSDSSLSDEDCGKYYDGPKPVFVFRRGRRQRTGSRRGRGR